MKPRQVLDAGIPNACLPVALAAVKAALADKASKANVLAMLSEVAVNPHLHVGNAVYGPLAQSLLARKEAVEKETAGWVTNPSPPPGRYAQWGDDIDAGAKEQMQDAVDLPVAVAGALMPDAHRGYGLPVGGVLATRDAVIPYAVGVDIACRMRLSVLDLPPAKLDDPFGKPGDALAKALLGGTVFGVGGAHKQKQRHAVMDADWTVTPLTRGLKDKAWSQLGTSGSGNHFAEFGLLTLEQPALGLEPGRYVALMTHSGSRGAGAAVCDHYSRLAKAKLPKAYERFINLAWLPMASEAGQEYWAAMNLMGEYAAANHAIIHEMVPHLAGAEVLATVENHHNYAWLEEHHGEKLYVHRKGATPAGPGVLGVIPGSMADPAFVVVGKGQPDSLLSASHGAGRRMSRTQASKTFTWGQWRGELRQRGVRVLSAGIDEVPGVYKNIHEVMAAQTALVDVVARFDPKVVRMSDDGKSED